MTSDTCFDILRHESNLTPKFLTVTAGTKLLPRMSVGKNDASSACCFLFPKTINSVLSGLSFNLFADIHNWTDDKHFCTSFILLEALLGVIDRYLI